MSCAGVEAGSKIDGVVDGPKTESNAFALQVRRTRERKIGDATQRDIRVATLLHRVELCRSQLAGREYMGPGTTAAKSYGYTAFPG